MGGAIILATLTQTIFCKPLLRLAATLVNMSVSRSIPSPSCVTTNVVLFLVGSMYVDQCPLQPFRPIFLIVFGISFVIMYPLMYKIFKAHEPGIWIGIFMAVHLFQWGWSIAGQFTSHILCNVTLAIRANKTFEKLCKTQMRIRCFLRNSL